MEDETNYADRKSRLVIERAGRSAPEMRSVGSITLQSPHLDAPVHLDGLGFTVYLKETERKGDLREAMLLLSHAHRDRLLWWEKMWFSVLGLIAGALIYRIYITLLYWR